MEDKEVGDIWRLAHTKDAIFTGWWRDRAVALIQKLVEERANHHHAARYEGDFYHTPEHSCLCELEALRDFNIDPKDWRVF